MRQTLLALSAVALVAVVAGEMSPAAAQDAGGGASCTAGAITDGTYETTERQRRNRGADKAENADNAGNAEKPRRAARTATDTEGTEVTEVTLTWQCSGTGPNGAFIPAGYKLELRGECPTGTCDLGTTVAMPGKAEGEYLAVLADETVGFRQLMISSKRKAVSLSVRTEVEGARKPAQSRYTLERKGGG